MTIDIVLELVMGIIGVMLIIIGYFILMKLKEINAKELLQDKLFGIESIKVDGIDNRLSQVEVFIKLTAKNEENKMILFEKLLDAKLKPLEKDIHYIKSKMK